MNRAFSRRTQRGIGMIEVALSVVIAGLFVLAFWTLTQSARQQETAVRQTTLLTRADLALKSFVFQNNRLPCPAPDNLGFAQAACSPSATGWLPFRDIDLPEARAGFIRYTLQGYPNSGKSMGTTSDNTAQLQLLVGQSPLNPTPVLVSPLDTRVNVAAPYMGFCSVVTSPMTAGMPLAPMYALQIQSNLAAARAGVDLPAAASLPYAADSTQTLSRSFAEVATELGCAPQLASSARTTFHNWLSTQLLLAGLNGYEELLAISVQAAIDDIVNDAIPAATSGAIRLEAKMVNVSTMSGKCAEGDVGSCATLGSAYADAATAAVNEALGAAKLTRDAMNEMAAATFNDQLAMQVMAVTALQSDLMRQHALWSVQDGVSP